MVKVSEQFPNVKFGFCRHTVTTTCAYHSQMVRISHLVRVRERSHGMRRVVKQSILAL